MADRVTPSESGFVALGDEIHPPIFSATVCSIVEHGGELLMVRQLNREGEERWNFPTGWMAPIDEDGHVQLPEHSVNRNLLMETGYAASDAHLIGVSVVREHDPDGHRVGTSLRLNYLSAHPRQTSYAVTDSDINRVWAPYDAKRSRLTYFAPSTRVMRRLIAYGVPAEHLAATGFADNEPLDAADTPDAYAKNRRIELRLTDR